MSIDYAKEYGDMLDGELVELAAESDSLVEEAQAALWNELRRRGLEVEASKKLEQRPPQEKTGPPPLHLITVASFSNLLKANAARSKLLSEGIDCFLADENVMRMDWFWASAIGWTKLQVREEDAGRARDVLTLGGTDSALLREYDVDTRRRGFRVVSLRVLAWLVLLETVVTMLIVLLSMLS